MVDPWGSTNEAYANLNSTFNNIRTQDRQAKIDDLSAQSARQQLAMGAIQLQGAQRQQSNLADATAAAQALKPTSRMALVDQQGPPQPVNNFASPEAATAGLSTRAALAQKIAQMKNQTYNPALSIGDNDVPPGTTNLTQGATDLQAQQIAPLQAQMDAIPATAQVAGPELPQVETQQNVPVTGTDRVRAMIKSYEDNGDITAATALKTQIAQHAKTVVDLSGNPADGIKIINDNLGTNYALAKTPSFQMLKNGDEIVGILDEGTMKLDVMNGMGANDAFKKNMAPVQLGGSSKLVADYLAKNPNATSQDVWKLASDNSIPIKAIEPIITRIQNAENERGKDERQQKQFAHSEENQQRMFAQQAKMFSERQQKLSIGMNQLNEDQRAALTKSIGAGLLDPYKINSKNQQVLADTAIANPGIDLNSLSAQLGVARNKDVVMKAGVAEMIPNLLKKTAEAGKALGYSNAKFLGIAEKWKNGQVNDPRLTKYMTLRNDQLLTIGGVMRSNGMTDMAQRLEEEAMHPTLAPKALDAWVEGQLESVDPRLNFYRSLTKGNKGIPRSDYVPGSGAAGLYGLKNAAPHNGTSTTPMTTKGGFKVTVVH